MSKSIKKIETLTPEVMPEKEANVHRSEHLLFIAQQIDEDFQEFGKLENQAAFRALRIGTNLIRIKEMLPHGEFDKWVAENIKDIRRTQAYNFRQLAEAFIRRKKLKGGAAFLLCAPEKDEDPKAKKITQLAFDFLGEGSLNDVFRRYGIRQGLPLGGHHPAKNGKTETTEELKRINAEAEWRVLMENMHKAGLEKKTWAYLPKVQIQLIDGLLTDLKREIRKALA